MTDAQHLLRERIAGKKHIELFCDFDGVLCPIAPLPGKAVLAKEMKKILLDVRDARGVHVSIVSGRSLKDLQARVGVSGIQYVGCHGAEMSGPEGKRLEKLPRETTAALRSLAQDLRAAVKEVPCAVLEDKRLCLTLHYRLCPPRVVEEVKKRFLSLVAPHVAAGTLRVTGGKAILEARPASAWDKGNAVIHLLESRHGPGWRAAAFPVYIGDDETDEDAFRALRKEGMTVHVGTSRGTSARCRLRSPDDVLAFLGWLAHTFRI